MSVKREYDDVDDGEIPEPDTKRAKKQNPRSRQHQNAGIDPTWGQKYVFSGSTTIPAGEESDFEDDSDAMAYLMSVRQEAGEIPHVLVAPRVQIGPQMPASFKRQRSDADGDDAEDGEISEDEGQLDRSIYTTGVGDTRGYYQDGAYVGIAEGEPNDEQEDSQASDQEDEATAKAIQDAYFTSLMEQYIHLRSILNKPPPPNATSRLPSSHPTHVHPSGRKDTTAALWSRLLHTTDPHPLQLASMPKDSVLRILRIVLGGKFLRQGYQLPERTSRWLWALLARLPDRGELNHAEVAWVRDLGRRAVLLGRSLSEMAALREELEEGGLGVHEGVDGSSSDEDVGMEGEEVGEDGESAGAQIRDPPSIADEPDKEPPDTEAQAERSPHEGDDEDVAMDIASDSEGEEGEASEPEDAQGLQDAKSRLLAQLDLAEMEAEKERAEEEARTRARINMRATLNMILTVAGEFYGQRDLLEFREPFVGM